MATPAAVPDYEAMLAEFDAIIGNDLKSVPTVDDEPLDPAAEDFNEWMLTRAAPIPETQRQLDAAVAEYLALPKQTQ